MEMFEVLKELRLGYGSHVRRLSPSRYKTHPPGTLVRLDVQAPDGTCWFIDPDGERGKIESGSVANLERREVIRPANTLLSGSSALTGVENKEKEG